MIAAPIDLVWIMARPTGTQPATVPPFGRPLRVARRASGGYVTLEELDDSPHGSS